MDSILSMDVSHFSSQIHHNPDLISLADEIMLWFMLQTKKVELKESLVIELEDKKRHIDQERNSVELTGGRWCT